MAGAERDGSARYRRAEGIEAVEAFLPDVTEQLERRRRRRQYWDLTVEGYLLNAADRSTRAPSSASSAQPNPSTLASTPAGVRLDLEETMEEASENVADQVESTGQRPEPEEPPDDMGRRIRHRTEGTSAGHVKRFNDLWTCSRSTSTVASSRADMDSETKD